MSDGSQHMVALAGAQTARLEAARLKQEMRKGMELGEVLRVEMIGGQRLDKLLRGVPGWGEGTVRKALMTAGISRHAPLVRELTDRQIDLLDDIAHRTRRRS